MKIKTLALALAMAPVFAAPAIIATTPAVAQPRGAEARWRAAERRFQSERSIYERERAIYERSRRGGYGDRRDGYDNRYGGGADDRYYWRDRGGADWEPSRYYREDSRYEERYLSSQDEVYRGNDGRYYCRRSDGTTGLVIGAGVGALVGRGIDSRGERTTGTVVGGVLGALLGREVERSQDVRCR